MSCCTIGLIVIRCTLSGGRLSSHSVGRSTFADRVVLRPTVEFCLVAVAFVLLFLTDEPDLLVVPFIIISEPDFSTAWREAVELVTEALLSVRIKPGSILEPDKVAA